MSASDRKTHVIRFLVTAAELAIIRAAAAHEAEQLADPLPASILIDWTKPSIWARMTVLRAVKAKLGQHEAGDA